jgi:shikimate dehydrogenase
MHNAAFEARGLAFKYEVLDTSDTKLAIEEMRSQNIRGYSLTIPHKEEALKLIDLIDSAAEDVGAVNTVINNKGILTGYNTDVFGIEEAIQEVRPLAEFKRALILGAGGAGRAAVKVLTQLANCEVYITNRTKERAEALASDFNCSALTIEEALKIEQPFDLLINSTPIGSHLAEDSSNNMASLVGGLSEEAVVFDMVTKVKTALLDLAEKQGLKTVSGPRMLLHQAVKKFELFTSTSPAPLQEMEKALHKELEKS